jgi:hypothetical protein
MFFTKKKLGWKKYPEQVPPIGKLLIVTNNTRWGMNKYPAYQITQWDGDSFKYEDGEPYGEDGLFWVDFGLKNLILILILQRNNFNADLRL